MRQKTISILAAASALLVFAGCQNVSAGSEPAFTSIQPGSSSVAEASAPQDTFGDISFAESPEMPGSLAITYPAGMFSAQPVWVDATHLYLKPGDNTDFGIIADIETRTLTQTEAFRYPYNISGVAYGEDCIYLHLGDSYVWKMDKSFKPVSQESYEEYNDFAVHMPTGTLYYFQQEDSAAGKAALYRKAAGGQPELLKELPDLGDKDFYSSLQVSPSGDKLLFYMIHYELNVKYIYVYDTKTDTLTEITHQYENSTVPGFGAAEGMWMGEQPVILLNHEYDNFKASSEIRYGIPPELKVEAFYNPLNDKKGVYNPENDIQCSLRLMRSSYLDCAIFEGHGAETGRQKLFYFRDNGTYLSYSGEGECDYPQLSPGYQYLVYSAAAQGREGYGEVCVIPTENLWKPLDWPQVQGEMEEMIGEMAKGKQG